MDKYFTKYEDAEAWFKEVETWKERTYHAEKKLDKILQIIKHKKEVIKNTKHNDGLGMGSQCCEETVHEILEEINVYLHDNRFS